MSELLDAHVKEAHFGGKILELYAKRYIHIQSQNNYWTYSEKNVQMFIVTYIVALTIVI